MPRIDQCDKQIAAIYNEVWRVECERDLLGDGDRRDWLDVESLNLREQARLLDVELGSLLGAAS